MNRRTYDLGNARRKETVCQWSSQSYTLQGITKSFSLPMVIKSDVESCSLAGQQFKLRLSEKPILLYSTRSKTKIVAKHLQYDGQQGMVSDGGQGKTDTLIIPEDYPGWFVHLKPSPGGVKCYNSINALCTAKLKAFVTGSNLHGLQVSHLPEGRLQYKPRNFLPGTVFRVDKVYVGKVRVQAAKFFLFRKTKVQDVKYLKCYDVHNREILLATDKPGKFFEIGPVFIAGSNKEKFVFNTEELFSLRYILSPVMLIHGQTPRVANFSGILQLQRTFLDETVVAATTVHRNQHVVLEIAVSSASTFHLALNSKEVIRHGEMGAAFKHCKRKGDQFVQKIRAPFAMSQENSRQNGGGSSEVLMFGNKNRPLDSISESDEEEEEDFHTSKRSSFGSLINIVSLDAMNNNEGSDEPTRGELNGNEHSSNTDCDHKKDMNTNANSGDFNEKIDVVNWVRDDNNTPANHNDAFDNMAIETKAEGNDDAISKDNLSEKDLPLEAGENEDGEDFKTQNNNCAIELNDSTANLSLNNDKHEKNFDLTASEEDVSQQMIGEWSEVSVDYHRSDSEGSSSEENHTEDEQEFLTVIEEEKFIDLKTMREVDPTSVTTKFNVAEQQPEKSELVRRQSNGTNFEYSVNDTYNEKDDTDSIKTNSSDFTDSGNNESCPDSDSGIDENKRQTNKDIVTRL